MKAITKRSILVCASAAVCVLGAPAHAACDINSTDPACGYISLNPLNPLSTSNPDNPASPQNPFNLANPNNPANPNSPANPRSPANPSSPKNLYNSYFLRNRLRHGEQEGSENYVGRNFPPRLGMGPFASLEGEHPTIMYYESGFEKQCKLGLDCPRSVYTPDIIAQTGQHPAATPQVPREPGAGRHKRRDPLR